jgi:hypothetical protein
MKAKITSMFNKTREAALDLGRKVAVAKRAPSEAQGRMILFTFGIVCLGLAFSDHALANDWAARSGQVEDTRIAQAVATLFTFLEGSFGALIMAASGIGAVLSAAFGQYKAALSCMVVAVGAFILRSMMNTFFNVTSIEGQGDFSSVN